MLPSDHFIIEINREAAGILARMGDQFQFFASAPKAFALNRQMFPTVRDAINAVGFALSEQKA
jgi:hypothetical protein